MEDPLVDRRRRLGPMDIMATFYTMAGADDCLEMDAVGNLTWPGGRPDLPGRHPVPRRLWTGFSPRLVASDSGAAPGIG